MVPTKIKNLDISVGVSVAVDGIGVNNNPEYW
jgi:hypothetical protein